MGSISPMTREASRDDWHHPNNEQKGQTNISTESEDERWGEKKPGNEQLSQKRKELGKKSLRFVYLNVGITRRPADRRRKLVVGKRRSRPERWNEKEKR